MDTLLTPTEPGFQSLALVVFCGWLMLRSGLEKKQLRWRVPRRRRCVGCHHELDDCHCDRG
jgi:hypothetical protein